MYANTTTGHIANISGNNETRMLQQLIVWNTVLGAVVQDASTTVEEWVGLSEADAISIATSSESSTLNGVTRSYLGTAKLTSEGGAYIRCVTCWGTKITSTYSRMGNTNCYQVTKTTTVYSVRKAGDDVILTLE